MTGTGPKSTSILTSAYIVSASADNFPVPNVTRGLHRYDLVLIAVICHPIHSAIACYYNPNVYHNNSLTIRLQEMDCMLSRWWCDGYASIRTSLSSMPISLVCKQLPFRA